MQYDVDYFIRKFEAIPEEMWCTHLRYGGGGTHCALGHIEASSTNSGKEEFEFKMLMQGNQTSLTVVRINNGDDGRYQQPTPKQRILAALYDIKKLNSEPLAQECDASKDEQGTKVGSIKTIHVYHKVSVPETLTESLPETVLS